MAQGNNTTLLLLLLRSLLVTCIVKLVCSMYGIWIILGLVFLKNYAVFYILPYMHKACFFKMCYRIGGEILRTWFEVHQSIKLQLVLRFHVTIG